VSNIPILEPPTHRWYCPNCGARDVTREIRPHSRFHTCPRLGMLTAPMLPEGMKAKVEAHEREDYIGSDLVRTDEDGRPIMSVTTEREDGTDIIVFAPTAVARA